MTYEIMKKLIPFFFSCLIAQGCDKTSFDNDNYVVCEVGEIDIPLNFFVPKSSTFSDKQILDNIDEVNDLYSEFCISFSVNEINRIEYDESRILENEPDNNPDYFIPDHDAIVIWFFEKIEDLNGGTHGGMARAYPNFPCHKFIAIKRFDRPILMGHELGHQLGLDHRSEENNMMNGSAKGQNIDFIQEYTMYNNAIYYKDICIP